MIATRTKWIAAVAFFAVAIVFWGACAGARMTRRTLGEQCRSTREDCAYGLECRVPLASEPKPRQLDGGPLVVPADAGTPAPAPAVAQSADGGPIRRCQYAMYAECSEEPGGPTCLSGQICREGHCTVQCALNAECGEGGICRIGVCQRRRTGLTQCYDNRDCMWPDTCFHGQCVTRTDAFRCNTDLDCGYGLRCLNGRCQ